MGKLSNVLYMIDLLNTGNIYTIKQLSDKIGVTERMIRYYKDEISKNGICIESFKGPNGGYFLIDKIKNYTSINKYDLKLLNHIYEILKQNNFKYIDKYYEFINKVHNMNDIVEEKSSFISNIKVDKKIELENIILNSIKIQDKITIIYDDIDGGISKRDIHPLQLFQYKENKYVTAYCELRHDIRHFEINRILTIE